MKQFYLVLTCVLIIATLLPAQTQVWKAQGAQNLALEDTHGNTYLARGYFDVTTDSLEKIGPGGETVWRVPIPTDAHLYQLLLSDAGVYVSPQRYGTPGVLYHYGT